MGKRGDSRRGERLGWVVREGRKQTKRGEGREEEKGEQGERAGRGELALRSIQRR